MELTWGSSISIKFLSLSFSALLAYTGSIWYDVVCCPVLFSDGRSIWTCPHSTRSRYSLLLRLRRSWLTAISYECVQLMVTASNWDDMWIWCDGLAVNTCVAVSFIQELVICADISITEWVCSVEMVVCLLSFLNDCHERRPSLLQIPLLASLPNQCHHDRWLGELLRWIRIQTH